MNLEDKKLNPFIDRIIVEALKPYENLYMRMAYMDERMNNRLRELLVPDLARFTTELNQT